jgi:glycosyltransferase involved in cell wall biosynthesis
MPTLLSINNYFYRRDGSEAVYLAHNELFGAAGWDVVPFSMQHPLNAGSEWSRHFVEEIEFGRDYTFGEKLKRVPKVIYSFEAQRKLERLLREVRPQIAHCHSIYHRLSPSILRVLRRARIPTVMTLHDLKIACPAYHMFDGQRICEKCRGGKIHNVLTNRCIKGSTALSAIILTEALVHRLLRTYESCVDLFVSPCLFYIDKLVEWGWPRSRFAYVPNFADETRLRPRFEPGKAILYFGSLTAEKGVLTLVRAAAAARVAIHIVGDGALLNTLRDLTSRLEARVTFLGNCERAALVEEIRAARAIVLPSEWYENAPMSVLESYALGKPVIGSDIGGLPEMIRPNITGWTFPAGSVSALAELLRKVCDMPDAAVAGMGQRARALVESDFSRARYYERVLELYGRLGVTAGRDAGVA